MFLALILKKTFSRIDTKIKINGSCFTLKCILVKSVKQYQGFTKDGEICWKVFKWNVEKYAVPGTGPQCDPCQSG